MQHNIYVYIYSFPMETSLSPREDEVGPLSSKSAVVMWSKVQSGIKSIYIYISNDRSIDLSDNLVWSSQYSYRLDFQRIVFIDSPPRITIYICFYVKRFYFERQNVTQSPKLYIDIDSEIAIDICKEMDVILFLSLKLFF